MALILSLWLALHGPAGTPVLERPPVPLVAGEVLVLRLPVPAEDWFWTLELDRSLLVRGRLPEYAEEAGAASQVWRFRAAAAGRTVVRGWCARAGRRPVQECRILVEIEGDDAP